MSAGNFCDFPAISECALIRFGQADHMGLEYGVTKDFFLE